MAPSEYKVLTQDQIDNFMKYGYVRIPQAFSAEKAASWTSQMWERLGYSPTDKSTWLQDRINMPTHKREHVKTFSPKAWTAMCELLGGEDRVDAENSGLWSDGFIVNLGTDHWERNGCPPPTQLDNWHVDGDFFVHFLDSPEQGLLVIPVYSDIERNGGGTMIAPDGIGIIARHLRDHPEGVSPRMVPVGERPEYQGLGWFIDKIQGCKDFHEMTGKTGDVILMHPLMLHSASRNSLRVPRVITNPLTSAKEPFNFDRENPEDYSLVERKTLKELGVERLKGWKITGQREAIVPERLKVHARMREAEERRLRGELVGGTNIAGTVIHEELRRAIKA